MRRHQRVGEVQCRLQFSNRAAIFLADPSPLLNVICGPHSRKHSINSLGRLFKLSTDGVDVMIRIESKTTHAGVDVIFRRLSI